MASDLQLLIGVN